MQVIVEILEKLYDEFGEVYYCPDNNIKKFEMKIGDKVNKIKDAKLKLDEIKLKLVNGQKVRVLEYHNDDVTHEPCKILYEEE